MSREPRTERQAALRLAGEQELRRLDEAAWQSKLVVSPRERIGAPTRPRIRTSRGIEIGGAYIQPPPPASDDAEAIQRTLLRKPPRTIGLRVADMIFATVLGVIGAALLVHFLAR